MGRGKTAKVVLSELRGTLRGVFVVWVDKRFFEPRKMRAGGREERGEKKRENRGFKAHKTLQIWEVRLCKRTCGGSEAPPPDHLLHLGCRLGTPFFCRGRGGKTS